MSSARQLPELPGYSPLPFGEQPQLQQDPTHWIPQAAPPQSEFFHLLPPRRYPARIGQRRYQLQQLRCRTLPEFLEYRIQSSLGRFLLLRTGDLEIEFTINQLVVEGFFLPG